MNLVRLSVRGTRIRRAVWSSVQKIRGQSWGETDRTRMLMANQPNQPDSLRDQYGSVQSMDYLRTKPDLFANLQSSEFLRTVLFSRERNHEYLGH